MAASRTNDVQGILSRRAQARTSRFTAGVTFATSIGLGRTFGIGFPRFGEWLPLGYTVAMRAPSREMTGDARISAPRTCCPLCGAVLLLAGGDYRNERPAFRAQLKDARRKLARGLGWPTTRGRGA